MSEKRLTPAVIVLIPLMVALNLVTGGVAAAIKLPVYLDSVGIVITAILAGPWVAATVGVATTLLGTVTTNPYYWAFSGTALCIGLAAGFLARAGFYRSRPFVMFVGSAIIAGVIITVVATITAAPVKVYLGGVTASGSDALVVLFRKTGSSLMESVVKGQFLSELADKVIVSVVAAFLAQSLSSRALTWFPGAAQRIKGAPAV